MNTMNPIVKNNVTITGKTDAATTLVFVHGFGTDQSVWQPVIADFTANYRIVLMDNVGFGRSAPEAFVQSSYLNLNQYAQDLVDVCVELKLTKPVLIGHSVGGMICALAILKKPDLASRLIMLGASPRYRNDEGYHGGFTIDDINSIYDFIESDYDEWTTYFANTMMGSHHPGDQLKSFRESLRSVPKERSLTVLCAILQTDYRDHIKNLKVPTLILQTTVDPAVPLGVAHFLQQEIKDSKLEFIEDEGHLPHITSPAKVSTAIKNYLVA